MCEREKKREGEGEGGRERVTKIGAAFLCEECHYDNSPDHLPSVWEWAGPRD